MKRRFRHRVSNKFFYLSFHSFNILVKMDQEISKPSEDVTLDDDVIELDAMEMFELEELVLQETNVEHEASKDLKNVDTVAVIDVLNMEKPSSPSQMTETKIAVPINFRRLKQFPATRNYFPRNWSLKDAKGCESFVISSSNLTDIVPETKVLFQKVMIGEGVDTARVDEANTDDDNAQEKQETNPFTEALGSKLPPGLPKVVSQTSLTKQNYLAEREEESGPEKSAKRISSRENVNTPPPAPKPDPKEGTENPVPENLDPRKDTQKQDNKANAVVKPVAEILDQADHQAQIAIAHSFDSNSKHADSKRVPELVFDGIAETEAARMDGENNEEVSTKAPKKSSKKMSEKSLNKKSSKSLKKKPEKSLKKKPGKCSKKGPENSSKKKSEKVLEKKSTEEPMENSYASKFNRSSVVDIRNLVRPFTVKCSEIR